MEPQFIGGIPQFKLEYLLKRISPDCPDCNGKMLCFCTQKLCSGQLNVFCFQCNYDHKLHRRNELKLLFLKNLKPYSELQKQTFRNWQGDLNELMLSFSRNENTNDIMELIELIGNAKAHLVTNEFGWLQKSRNLLLKIYANKPYRTLVSEFQQTVLKMDIYSSFNQNSSFPKVKSVFQASNRRGFFEQKFSQLRKDEEAAKKMSIQNFIIESYIQKIVRVQQATRLEACVSDSFGRSQFRTHMSAPPHQEVLKAERVIISTWERIQKKSLVLNLSENTAQLHTRFHFSPLPPNLVSLTYSAFRYDPNYAQSIGEFPASLKRLAIEADRDTSRSFSFAGINKFIKLKWLTIANFNLSNKSKKLIVKFAIANNLQMLCFLRHTCKLEHLRPKHHEAKIEVGYVHEYPNLQRHYLLYKRKLLQAMLLSRHKALYWSSQYKQILKYTNCYLDKVVKQEFP